MKKNLLILCLIFLGLYLSGLSLALRPEEVQSGHVWLFEDGKATDSTKNNLTGTFVGNPKGAKGVRGNALAFNGQNDGIRLADSSHINTGGPWTNRTIRIVFNCSDVSKKSKQVLYEEGGRTRGLVVYVFDGRVYVGGWNRSEYNWNGEWIFASIKSNTWYEVASILRDTQGKVEADKFEMWLDGRLVEKRSGGQLHAHGDDCGIGFVNQNTVYHDEGGSGTDIDYYEGLIDEVWVVNLALTNADLKPAKLSVDVMDKLASKWGKMKSLR